MKVDWWSSDVDVPFFEHGNSPVKSSFGRFHVTKDKGFIAPSAFFRNFPSIPKLKSIIFDVLQYLTFDLVWNSGECLL